MSAHEPGDPQDVCRHYPPERQREASTIADEFAKRVTGYGRAMGSAVCRLHRRAWRRAPMAIGGDLRAARRARKRSIDDISRTTKIAPAILRALEKDDFDAVPGGLFTRGFLRAYAHDVGLDGEDLVRRYRAEQEPPGTAATTTSQTIASQVEVRAADPDEPPSAARHSQIIQFAVILVIALGYLASLRPAKPPTC